MLGAADEGGELLAAEHPQPVQPDHVTQAGSENDGFSYERQFKSMKKPEKPSFYL